MVYTDNVNTQRAAVENIKNQKKLSNNISDSEFMDKSYTISATANSNSIYRENRHADQVVKNFYRLAPPKPKSKPKFVRKRLGSKEKKNQV